MQCRTISQCRVHAALVVVSFALLEGLLVLLHSCSGVRDAELEHSELWLLTRCMSEIHECIRTFRSY